MQEVIISYDITETLNDAISHCSKDNIFILVDQTTQEHCLSQIQNIPILKRAKVITIGTTDAHKNLETLAHVWKELQTGKATRHSLLINLGGGMVTDLGAFAASTFKRGINFINIPTTLLSMVDAAVGGKTGINFNGLKNEIGTFYNARYVLLSTHFLSTLDDKNIRSGYAEMLKHGLISNHSTYKELINFDLDKVDLQQLQTMVASSVKVKERIVKEDPLEQGIRKALNVGHTIGHALEAFTLHNGTPILHGYAVAYGIICELYLSRIKMNFPKEIFYQTISYINKYYGCLPIECKHYDQLIELMCHDKKNIGHTINFTLLSDIGEIHINQTATEAEIKEALDFYRDGQ